MDAVEAKMIPETWSELFIAFRIMVGIISFTAYMMGAVVLVGHMNPCVDPKEWGPPLLPLWARILYIPVVVWILWWSATLEPFPFYSFITGVEAW